MILQDTQEPYSVSAVNPESQSVNTNWNSEHRATLVSDPKQSFAGANCIIECEHRHVGSCSVFDAMSCSIYLDIGLCCSLFCYFLDLQRLREQHDTSRLEKEINRWAAGIVTTSRASLDMLCHAIATDSGIESQTTDISPMHAQGLLRNAMVEVISSGIINTFNITNRLQVDTELTRIYRTISSSERLNSSP
jgi:hypothetical protein